RDALVGLVRYEELHVLGPVARLLQNLARHVGHRAHGDLEQLIPLHLEEVQTFRQRLGCGRYARSAAGRVELFGETTVGINPRGEYASVFFSRPQNGCARAVAEQNAGRAVFEVNVARENLRADDERVARLPRAYHLIRNRQAVEKAGAGGGEVEGGGAVRAELGLYETARRREYLVGRDRRADDEADVNRVDARALDCLARGGDGEHRSVLALCGAVALLYPRARRYPLVRGLDHPLKV